MTARHFLPGGYPNPDPYYISPEEEAAMYDGPPDWDEAEEPVADSAEALMPLPSAGRARGRSDDHAG